MYSARLYIDNKDVYRMYGAFLAGSLKDIVCFPPMKKVRANDWGDEDGTDVDLSASGYRYDTKGITLKFGFHGPAKDDTGFMEMLSDSVYHTFDFRPLCASDYASRPTLRLVSNPSINDMADGRLGMLTLKFSDDDFGYVIPADAYPAATIARDDAYSLNGIPFTDINVNVLKGSLNNIRKMSDVKAALTRKHATANGVWYDAGSAVRFKSREVKVNCLLRAETPASFWLYHQRLFNELIRPGGHSLYVAVTDTTYPCYYTSCSVSEFYTEIGGIVWMKFTLSFTLTADLRGDVLSGILLAAEDGGFILTEEKSYINMMENRI